MNTTEKTPEEVKQREEKGGWPFGYRPNKVSPKCWQWVTEAGTDGSTFETADLAKRAAWVAFKKERGL